MASQTHVVQVAYNAETHEVQLKDGSDFQTLHDSLVEDQRFPSLKSVDLTYASENGEQIMISSSEDLKAAFQFEGEKEVEKERADRLQIHLRLERRRSLDITAEREKLVWCGFWLRVHRDQEELQHIAEQEEKEEEEKKEEPAKPEEKWLLDKYADADLEGEDTPLSEAELKTKAGLEEALGREEIASLPEDVVIRFIRGYATEKDPLQAATDYLRKCLAWRKEHNVDTILEREVPKFELYRQLWMCGVHGRDKQGRAVYVERVGKVSPKKILANFTTEEMQLCHIRMLEELSRKKDVIRRSMGRQVYKHTAILDLKGMGMAHISKKLYKQIKDTITIDQYYYPESLFKLFITNAPFIFKMFWAIAKPWVHPLTRARIKMSNSKVFDYIEIENVPKFLGGQCKCKEGKCLQVPFVRGKEAPKKKKK